MKLLFRMTPQGAFYSGSEFVSHYYSPFPKSDTVFQAIRRAWEQLWGAEEASALLEKFQGQAPFSMTGIFPVVGDSYFLPRPRSFRFSDGPKNVHDDLFWISARVYARWLKKEDISWKIDYFLSPGLYVDEEDLKSLPDDLHNFPLWSDDQGRMRNHVTPGSTEVEIFPAGQIHYAAQLEFYLLVESDDSHAAKLDAVFRLLADEGIGGRRSTGCGGYLYQASQSLPESLKFVDQAIDEAFVNLSLFYPHPEDLKNDLLKQGHYRLIERQGWRRNSDGTPVQTLKLRMIEEGGHFRFKNIHESVLVDVTPQDIADQKFFNYVRPFCIAAPSD